MSITGKLFHIFPFLKKNNKQKKHEYVHLDGGCSIRPLKKIFVLNVFHCFYTAPHLHHNVHHLDSNWTMLYQKSIDHMPKSSPWEILTCNLWRRDSSESCRVVALGDWICVPLLYMNTTNGNGERWQSCQSPTHAWNKFNCVVRIHWQL